jgi:hypothetical protein
MISIANIAKHVVKDSSRRFRRCSVSRVRNAIETRRGVRTASNDREEASNRRHVRIAVVGGRASLTVPHRNVAAMLCHLIVRDGVRGGQPKLSALHYHDS